MQKQNTDFNQFLRSLKQVLIGGVDKTECIFRMSFRHLIYRLKKQLAAKFGPSLFTFIAQEL
jgi:hypothetical protein